jgi:CBS domain-containing protein
MNPAQTTRLDAANMKVADIMQTSVLTVEPTMSVAQLARTLLDRQITGAPVIDRGGSVVGVVSASDVLRLVSSETTEPPVRESGPSRESDAQSEVAFALEESESGSVSAFFRDAGGTLHQHDLVPLLAPTPFGARTVADIMMPARLSVRPSTTVQGLARFLLTAKVHRALVLERGLLRGIVTTFDVLRVVAGERNA